MIDPSIWDSEQVQSLSGDEFKLYLYTISNSDDEGRMVASAPMIRAKAFPLSETITTKDVARMVNRLHALGLLRLIADESSTYLYHPNWTRYQTIDRPKDSRLPNPSQCEEIESIDEQSPINRRRIVPKGREEKLEEENTRTDHGDETPPPPEKKQHKKEPASPLYHFIEQAFLSKNGNFTNWPKEAKGIHGIEQKCAIRAPDSPETFAAALINHFWELKQTGKPFYRDGPFTPSRLNSIFDDVAEGLRNREQRFEDLPEGVFR